LRSKCKVLGKIAPISSLSEIPVWNFDGSSTGQAHGADSEILLKPVSFYPNPFLKYPNILVLCACYEGGDLNKPSLTNFRHDAIEIFNNESVQEQQPWFGIEQEYTLFDVS